jgi:hypothetical protein
MGSMSLAHLGEYLFVARYHVQDLKWDSFLINQSYAYIISFVIS